MTIDYQVRPSLNSDRLSALYAAAWPEHGSADFAAVLERALTYIWALEGDLLVGSVYVAWDGAQHAFLLEPLVRPEYRRRGIGQELVRRAAEEARLEGCEWLHVDYGPELAPFYAACGFRPTSAGLIRLDTGA